MKYEHSRHSVHLMNHHLVWCPKYRRPVLTGNVKNRLEQLIEEEGPEGPCEALALEVLPAYLHLFALTSPTTKASEIVKAVKGRSSHRLRQDLPHMRRLPTLWTSSYFASTAGNVNSETIKSYIKARSTS